ncbi:MAG: fibronectin type III domain-containing protein [Gemmataceae bacterium]|nr:fibronectin type III domain-containing protein [Gemmataceae bacterium]
MKRLTTYRGRKAARLTFLSLEKRDLPSGGVLGLSAPAPGTDELVALIDPFAAAGRGKEIQHGGGCSCGLCQTLAADVKLMAMGPFQGPNFGQPPVIANTSPGGGPAGPISPIPTTYTTAANGMPQLNSSPSSPVAIYLDFDGETVGSTVYSTYNVTGSDAATFDAAEQATIYETWRQIHLYYSMFDVNVTTVKPVGVPTVWQLISNSISGGYAYVGAFPNSQPQGFNQSSDARTRISGIAHEIGHNFALSHQSDYDLLAQKTAEYSSGYSLHGPIMGVDFAQNVHKFVVNHPSYSASSLQDDLQLIANEIKPYQPVGGDGFRPDEHGNNAATATILVPDTGSYEGWGVIERPTDIDAFSFTSVGGLYGIYGNPATPSSLDIRLELFDSAGNRMATIDPVAINEANAVVDLPAGTYTLTVTGHGDYADLGAYQVSMRPLPAGWSSTDIGTVITGGFAGLETTGVWRVSGSGSDIAGTSDSFRYAYTTLTGNGTIVAKVTNVDATNTAAKAGVMIRETTAANSRMAYMTLTPTAAQFITRTSAGGTAAITNGTGQFPYWVRLTRTGNTLTGSVSPDGVTWTTVGSTTVSMASQVTIGLAVSAKNSSHYNQMNDATFENVAVTGDTSVTPPTLNALPAPTGLALTLATGTGITANWSAVVGATSYAVDRSTDGVVWSQVTTTASTSYTVASITGGQRYFYRVASIDGTGLRSVNSDTASIINRPDGVTNFEVVSYTTTALVLDWRETNGETGYRVERSVDGGTNWTTLGTVAKNFTSYTNSGLTPATSYSYRVTPLSDDGDGPTSTVITASTRLAAISGLTITSLASTQVSLSWVGGVAGATGYRVQHSTDGTTFTTLATITGTTYTATGLTALTENYFRVAAVNALSESITQPLVFTATPPATALPSPWISADVGSVTGKGATGLTGSTFKTIGSGSTIGSTADSFQFAYQPLTADGTLIARVATHEDTTGTSTGEGAGIMIRESLNANSRMAFVGVTPSSGARFATRTSTGGTAAATTVASVTAPEWVRLVRAGNTLTASYSADGVTWTQIGSTTTISMAATVYAGMAVYAGSTTLLNTSTFDNVSLDQADTPPRVLQATPTGATASPVTSVTLDFSRAMNTSSFSIAADVLSFTGPAGNLLSNVTGFGWASPTSLRIDLAPQVVPGSYSLAVGPQILGTNGKALDQDGDNIPGESTDGFTANFTIGRSTDGFGYAWNPIAYDASLNIQPTDPGVSSFTALNNIDDSNAAFNLGANTFRFYNSVYTGASSLFLASNGIVTFGSGSSDYTNLDLTATPPQATIAALWDDLVTNRNTTTDDVILTKFVDLNNDGTADRLIINWRNVHYYVQQPTSGDDGITFQMSLELNTGSRPGDIILNYVDLNEAGTGTLDGGFSSTTGIKDVGTQGGSRLLISQDGSNSSFIASSKAVRIFVNTAPTANAGGPYTLTGATTKLSAGASSDLDQSTASLNYLWDLDGDGIFGETGPNAARGAENVMEPTFSGLGLTGPQDFPVQLKVIDEFGVQSSSAATIAIPAPPTVANVQVNDGSVQRSRVSQLVVTFDRTVSLPPNPSSAFIVSGPGGIVTTTPSVNNSGPATIVTLTFPELIDGKYSLTVVGSNVTDLIGQAIVGTPTTQFHRLFGDSDGDGTVSNVDFLAFRAAFLSSNYTFDGDGDGTVTTSDFLAFRLRFLTSV